MTLYIKCISLIAIIFLLYQMGGVIWDLWEARMSLFGGLGNISQIFSSQAERANRLAAEITRQQQMQQAIQQWNGTPMNWATVTAMSSSGGLFEAQRQAERAFFDGVAAHDPVPDKIEPVPLGELTVGMEQGDRTRITKWL